ncbi:MAG TPA: phosphatase PAP2 family protein, partial [Gemmatimonadales bacterium]|nr:phosphatase PAP2 family protein [Gemmatimonadales bacterium]
MHIVLLTLSLVASVQAVPHATPAQSDTGFHHIRWYEAAAAVGGTAAVMVLDQPVQRFLQRHRTETTDDIADVFRQGGAAPIALLATGGLTLSGVVAKNDKLRDDGLRAGVSIFVGTVAAEALKVGIGRGRPASFTSATDFRPFTSEHDTLGVESRGSFPSGHTVVAFALATSLADDIHHTPASVALYTIAAGTGLSRLNDDRHWLSDVVGGMVIGVTSARLVSGRWRVFGLRPPSVLLAPDFVALRWHQALGP